MDLQSFFRTIQITRPEAEHTLIQSAYSVATTYHEGQKRDSQECFIIHPRRVAIQLIDHGYGQTQILVGALLHDVVEMSDVTKHVIVSSFGETMWEWICTLSNVTLVHDPHSGMVVERIPKRPDNFFGSIAEACFEVRIIKLADRLDNLMDTKPWGPEQIKMYIDETRTYITPIALSTSPCFAREIRDRCNILESELSSSIPSPKR